VTVPIPPARVESTASDAKTDPVTDAVDAAPTLLRRILGASVPWVISLVLVIAEWGLTQLKKPDDAIYDSFVTRTEVGEQAEARNLIATVTDVHVARSVSDGDDWRAEGAWVVVDLDAAAAQTQTAALLRAQLRIGERTFSATERGDTGNNLRLITGVPRHGSVAFEVPDEALDDEATIVLSWHRGDDADGLIEVAVDLDQLAVEDEVVLDEIGWAQ